MGMARAHGTSAAACSTCLQVWAVGLNHCLGLITRLAHQGRPRGGGGVGHAGVFCAPGRVPPDLHILGGMECDAARRLVRPGGPRRRTRKQTLQLRHSDAHARSPGDAGVVFQLAKQPCRSGEARRTSSSPQLLATASRFHHSPVQGSRAHPERSSPPAGSYEQSGDPGSTLHSQCRTAALSWWGGSRRSGYHRRPAQLRPISRPPRRQHAHASQAARLPPLPRLGASM